MLCLCFVDVADDWQIDLDPGPQAVSDEWWAEYVKEEDQNKMEHSGKLILLFDILRMCEEIGDKVWVLVILYFGSATLPGVRR